MSGRRWTRRSALALGLSAVGTGLVVRRAPADVSSVTLGEVTFDVPATVQPSAEVPGVTRDWAWQGISATGRGTAPSTLVLARSDLDATDPEEVLGLLLAGAADGQLPDLVTQPRRTRSLGGRQGDQVRIDLSYQANQRRRYHGTLLVATRARPPAAVLVVLGDDTLTAGTVGGVLDSLRWTS